MNSQIGTEFLRPAHLAARLGLALTAAIAGCSEPNTYVEPPPPVTVAQPRV